MTKRKTKKVHSKKKKVDEINIYDISTILLEQESLVFRKKKSLKPIRKYTIEKQIGRGGMGDVFLGYQKALNRKVAIKIIRDEMIHVKAIRKTFKNEAKILASLDHPCIVRVIDLLKSRGLLTIIMEYVEGKDLNSFKGSKKLKLKKVFEIIYQILDSLEYLKQKDIVHRDIKPSNILLNDDVIKVTDFGLAQLHPLKSGSFVGTAYYASPEQFNNEILDIRSDIYSLGITLYEMLTGTVPFNGSTPLSICQKHLKIPPTPLYLRNNMIPLGLSKFVEKMIQKDKNKRFQSPAEAKKCLEDIERGEISIFENDLEKELDVELSESPRKFLKVVASSLKAEYFDGIPVKLLVPIGKDKHPVYINYLERDNEGDQIFRFYSPCRYNSPEIYAACLRYNFDLPCGGFALKGDFEDQKLVLTETQLIRTAEFEEVRNSISSIATGAYFIENKDSLKNDFTPKLNFSKIVSKDTQHITKVLLDLLPWSSETMHECKLYSLNLKVKDNRRQVIYLEPVYINSDGMPVIKIRTSCGPFLKEFTDYALRLNFHLSYGIIACCMINKKEHFIMIDSRNLKTIEMEEMRKSTTYLAEQGDLLEKELHKSDVF